MSIPVYDLDTARERGLLRFVSSVEAAGRGRWLVTGRRPFYIEAAEWEIRDAGLDVVGARSNSIGGRSAFFVGL